MSGPGAQYLNDIDGNREDEVADLTPDEKRALKTAVEREARQRAQRRKPRRS